MIPKDFKLTFVWDPATTAFTAFVLSLAFLVAGIGLAWGLRYFK